MAVPRVRRRSGVRLVLLTGWAGLLVAAAPARAAGPEVKHRIVLVVPVQAMDVPREARWLGAGVAEVVKLTLAQLPGVIQVDRARLARLPSPEAWDDAAVVAAARAVHADVVLYGELRRDGGEVNVRPKIAEIRADRVERVPVDAMTMPEGEFLARLHEVPLAFVRALKLPVSEAEVGRMRKVASPTTSLRALEAYVRGKAAGAAATKDAHEAAVDHLARAVELDPQFAAAQYDLGAVHHALGNRWKAAAQFRAASQLDPAYPEPLKALGDLYLAGPRRLFAEALEAYGKAIELRPFFAEAHVGLGDARAAKGDVDGAIAAYQKALVHNPLNPRVHVSLGKIYYSEKNLYYEAVTAYKKAVELDPADIDARMGLAEVYEDKGLYAEAVAEYKTVVAQDAKHTGALYNLALVYEKVDPKESISLWERYIQLAGSLPSEKDWVDVARLHLRKLRSQFGGN